MLKLLKIIGHTNSRKTIADTMAKSYLSIIKSRMPIHFITNFWTYWKLNSNGKINVTKNAQTA